MDIDFDEAELLGIIGANGSGKTTLFNCITGFLRPDSGRVRWLGADVTGRAPHRLARAGLVRTFQQPMCFRSGSVRENIAMASAIAGSGSSRTHSGVDELVELVGLTSVASQAAASLPYGILRSLGVAVALAGNPRLLLLDEPGAGLNDGELRQFSDLLRRVRQRGVSIAVIDHDMDFLLPLVDRLLVLDVGKKIAEGTPEEVRRTPQVIDAYLGARFAVGEHEHLSRASTESGTRQELLTVEHMKVSYGAIQAVRGVDLTVNTGEAVALLGPNGAGKTTLLRAISRLLPYSGKVTFDGRPLQGPPERVVRSGVAHVLEGRHVFTQLTVRENLLVPRLSSGRKGYSDAMADVLDTFPVLRDTLDRLAGQLSGGQQQQLSIARSLLTRPRLLILDEPSLGLAPVIIDQLRASLARFKDRFETSLLIAEQSLPLALDVADRYYLLRRGKIIETASTKGAGVRERILESYLGGGGALHSRVPDTTSLKST